MPIIYLSPSTQEANQYVTGGTEEYWMNKLADNLVPWLRSSGIRYVRNTPEMTAGSSLRASNEGTYDLHIALHSNAAPEGKYGTSRGIIVFYAPGSTRGKRMAEIFAQNLRTVYPLPDQVKTMPTTNLGEVTKTRAPANLLELGYHDNAQDAAWITGNLPEIAENLALSLTEYFGIPLISPQPERTGRVKLQSGNLNIRSKPNLSAPVLILAPNGAVLTVLGEWNGWYLVNYGGTIGYAKKEYILVA
ncbi:MAG TPA: SH3 domain-containing protein [Oscillospiraceae bacterium]|nr:SH3 domain-containing protein [Oscillospiraceae bacterium]HRW56436.1 SH3 domain-containing protein [Oscillospiraceae bacterium]